MNVGLFAYSVWKILQPLLPKSTLNKISIVGTEKKEIVDVLSKEMSLDIIPEYLGGENRRTSNDDLIDK